MKIKTLHIAALMASAALALPLLAAPAKKPVAKKTAAKPAAKKAAKPAAKSAAKPGAKAPVPAGMEVAKFVLPPAFYAGTPKQIKNTTAKPHVDRKEGSVLVPKGSTNVALNKPVTSSDEAPIIGTLSMITDGDKDAKEGSWVELGFGTQWVQIDLQKNYNIHGVLLWHYHGESRVYRDIVVQVADDADFVTNVRTVFNNDNDNSSGLGAGKDLEFYEHRMGQWIPIKAQKARYVRLYSRGNTSDPQNQYIEVEVWGTPAK